jgi:hypothetical protein
MLPAARAILTAALIASPTLARADDAIASAPDEGLFLGARYRWREMNLVPRVLHDVVAIPGNVGRWQGEHWAQLAVWTAAVGGLMFAGTPSPDVRVDRWTAIHLNPRLPTFWTFENEAVLWTVLGAGGLGTWGWAAATGRGDVAQGMSLLVEALAVSQIYHLSLKLALGREGPENGDGDALILGPANAVRVYPSGTPSGHSATLYSLLSAGFAYFRPPAWVQVLGHVLVGSAIALHVIEHQHFLSDSLWGAVMGWYVGQWVVKHRASSLYGEGNAAGVMLMPLAVDGGAGVAIQGFF